MLSLQEIEKFYPQNLQSHKRHLLREYLQYKILQAVFAWPSSSKLCFLGGTCLRLIHNNQRFSEDLDFDNFGLTAEEFGDLSEHIKKRLILEGFQAEIRNVYKGAFRCYLRFPKILYDFNLSGHEGEKILVQIDTLAHHFDYTPDKPLLNRFDVFTEILATPLPVLLSQKIGAALSRKTPKGRDFYDIVFLFSLTTPSYDYLKAKYKIGDVAGLKKELARVTESFDFKALAKDVMPFLFNPEEVERVLLFPQFIKSL